MIHSCKAFKIKEFCENGTVYHIYCVTRDTSFSCFAKISFEVA